MQARPTRRAAAGALALAAALAAAPAGAGKLDGFEDSVRGGGSGGGGSDGNRGSLSSFESGTQSSAPATGVAYPWYYHDLGCWYCGFHHPCLWHHGFHPFAYGYPPPRGTATPPGGSNTVAEVWAERVPGSPVLPRARVDAAWQAVEEDVEALDLALELGYSALAVRGRLTRYEEDDPDDTLDLSSVLLLFRLPLSRALEFDVGAGRAELSGNDRQSGLDVGVALRGWSPARRLGLEYRGEFMDIGTGLNSNELGVLLHYRQLAVRVGYRWLRTTGNSLDGPLVGAALSF